MPLLGQKDGDSKATQASGRVPAPHRCRGGALEGGQTRQSGAVQAIHSCCQGLPGDLLDGKCFWIKSEPIKLPRRGKSATSGGVVRQRDRVAVNVEDRGLDVVRQLEGHHALSRIRRLWRS